MRGPRKDEVKLFDDEPDDGMWTDQDWADYYGVDVEDLEDAMDDDTWD